MKRSIRNILFLLSLVAPLSVPAQEKSFTVREESFRVVPCTDCRYSYIPGFTLRRISDDGEQNRFELAFQEASWGSSDDGDPTSPMALHKAASYLKTESKEEPYLTYFKDVFSSHGRKDGREIVTITETLPIRPPQGTWDRGTKKWKSPSSSPRVIWDSRNEKLTIQQLIVFSVTPFRDHESWWHDIGYLEVSFYDGGTLTLPGPVVLKVVRD